MYALPIIDVVIPCHPKDQDTLDKSIDGIRRYGQDVRRIIVISENLLTKNAEWVPESVFPFSKYDVAEAIFKDKEAARKFVEKPKSRVGWIYKQLLNFYAPFVIDNISENVLVLDADLIFVKPVQFIDKNGRALFAPGMEYHRPYFEHATRLIPGFKRVYPQHSGIFHHMLFQKYVLKHLINLVETTHNKKFWEAFCDLIDVKHVEGSSVADYEIYFNFMFIYHKQMAQLRPLKMINCDTLKKLDQLIIQKTKKYDCISCQEYFRVK